MAEEKRTFVIAISSISGGGKTTVVEKLNEILPNSKVLHFDDYDFKGPENIVGWVKRGADYSEWCLKPFVEDMEALLAESLDYIVLDFPFSYKHPQANAYISLSVFIDTPLDIALARRIIRDSQDESAKNIVDYMKHYNLHGRPAYLEMLHTIKPTSDFIVDGSLPVSEIVNTILDNKRNCR